MTDTKRSWLRIAGGKLLYITYRVEPDWHYYYAYPIDWARTFSMKGISSVEHGLARFLQEIDEDYGTR